MMTATRIRKGDWHKKNENNQRVHKDNEGNTIVDKSCGHRCICGYKTCPKLWEEYSGTGHVYDRANIRLGKSDNPLWLPFQESLLRNLHVSEEMGEAIITAPKGYRFSVAPYHFTEKVVAKYWSNPAVRGAWKQRFTRQEAEGLLHLPPMSVTRIRMLENISSTQTTPSSVLPRNCSRSSQIEAIVCKSAPPLILEILRRRL